MPVVANNFTAGKPLINSGLTGVQSIKFIHAPRVFIKSTPDSQTAAVVPIVKSNGSIATITATGWTDLGIVDGNLKVAYAKKTNEVRTGIDNYLRAAYAKEKGGTLDFSLAQFDDTALGAISNLTASQVTSNSIYSYHVGQEDLAQFAVLFIVVNKLNGKEIQWYSPLVFMNFEFADATDHIVLKCSAMLPAFTAAGQANEEFLTTTVFA